MTSEQIQCRRCGTCCLKGGPALHKEDLLLITRGNLAVDKLITVRRGELVIHPLTGKLQTVDYEFIKLTGTGRDWSCVYYSCKLGCTIYERRPIACRVLKCWDPAEISGFIGKDTLTRLDILAQGDPLRLLVEEYERLCPCPDMESVRRSLAEGTLRDISSLQHLVDADLDFRSRVVREMKISLAMELFIFGRPIFQLLKTVGMGISEIAGRIRLAV
jgi:Fe-S-cluster containining protein